MTTIGEDAFRGCGLTSVTIPATVTTIGENAFYNCSNLTSLTIEPGDNRLKLNGPINTGGSGYALSVGRNLTLNSAYSVFFPDATSAELGGKMTAVNSDLFYSASKLTSITIGSSVTSIGEYAFSTTGLTSVTIPATVTTIGEEAFSYCSKLTEAVFSEGMTQIGGFYGCTNLTSVTIPSTVTTIGEDAFRGCGLTSVTIPATVTTIGEDAFYNCSNLTNFTIEPGDNKLKLNGPINTGGSGYALSVGRNLTLGSGYYGFFPDATSAELGGKMTAVNGDLFYNASKLASITIGSSVTSIGQEAFSNSGLTSVKIPATVTTIGEDAFSDCSKLTEAVFSEGGVTKIGGFSGCRSLTSVTIPSTVKTIDDEAFSNCGLTSFTVPPTVTTIGEDAFYYCTKLTSFTIEPGDSKLKLNPHCIYSLCNFLIIKRRIFSRCF